MLQETNNLALERESGRKLWKSMEKKLRIPWKKIGSNAVLRDCRTWNDKEEKLLESHAFIVHNILLQDLFLYPILGTRNALGWDHRNRGRI